MISGLPFLNAVDLDMDFGEDKLFEDNQFISNMGRELYAKNIGATNLVYPEDYY